MTTVSDLGMTGIKKGMFFKDHSSTIVDKYEVLTDPAPSTYYNDYVVDILIHYTDNTTATQKWFSYETEVTGWVGKFELMGEFETSDNDKYYWTKYQSVKPEPICHHYSRKKVIVFNLSGYWMCENCKADLGTLTEEEFYQAVKEQTGGKPVKKAPPMGQTRRRR